MAFWAGDLELAAGCPVASSLEPPHPIFDLGSDRAQRKMGENEEEFVV
jgi:hypothetical protein